MGPLIKNCFFKNELNKTNNNMTQKGSIRLKLIFNDADTFLFFMKHIVAKIAF